MENKIIIINGPNLNLLGDRENDKYGDVSIKQVEKECHDYAKKNKLNIAFYQSNIEGEIVNKIQESRNNMDGIIINAAGYTHTSVSIRDALAAIKKPSIELHITNIYKREDFRHKSLISGVVNSVICGFGIKGYLLALEAMKNILLK